MINIKKLISDGVDLDSNGVKFDFATDSPDTALKLYVNKKDIKFHSLGGVPNIFYAYYFSPSDKTVKKDVRLHKINSIRTAIKSYSDQSVVSNVDKMIEFSLNRFNILKPLSSFDTIIPLKSSSPLNDVIASKVKHKNGADIMSELIVKDVIKNISIDLPDSETNPKTLAFVDDIRDKFSKVPNDEFRSKMVPASFRRYISKFLKFNNRYDKTEFEKLNGKNILVIDDTLGEGSTLKEIQRLLYQYSPSSVCYFVFIKDY